MDTGVTEKKPPRKPRPSEIAAKKAKAAAKKAAKTKAKKRKAPKVVKAKRDRRRKLKVKPAGNGRTERLDMRVTKDQKRQLIAKAKKLGRPVTSVAWEAISRGLKGLR